MKATKTTTVKKSATGMGSLFDKPNFTWMLIGIGVLALGLLLMAGGKSSDPNVFNTNQVYSARRITIAPIIILAGLAIEIIAIFKGNSKRETTNSHA